MVKPNAKTRDSRLSKIQQKWIYPPSDKRWVKFPLHVLDGEAWHSLNLNERRFIETLMCEHAEQWAKSNGELQVSYNDLIDAGISSRYRVSEAKDRLLKMGPDCRQGRRQTRPEFTLCAAPLRNHVLPQGSRFCGCGTQEVRLGRS
jgi:hypothetical protein